MSLLILKSGILTTFQDLGRNGYRRFGINPNGAMDRTAARLINILLGNAESETVLEIHYPAPIFEFESEAVFALGGGDFAARLNETEIENWRGGFARKGDRLTFPEKRSGARLYLAVKGGFETEKWLGSSSANLKAAIGKPLQKGDKVLFKDQSPKTENQRPDYKISFALVPRYSRFPTVRVTTGAEFERLEALSAEIFLKNGFAVSLASDRMGFRLAGEPLYLSDKAELVSSAVNFGTIQLLPDGQMIILMADHQTTGGYPRLAHVAAVDLPLVAQLSPNDKVFFKLISNEEAEELFFEREKDFNFLKTAVDLTANR